jgi:hypothetical protein
VLDFPSGTAGRSRLERLAPPLHIGTASARDKKFKAGSLTMSIQKKSLISTLKTAKKANIASAHDVDAKGAKVASMRLVSSKNMNLKSANLRSLKATNLKSAKASSFKSTKAASYKSIQ